MSDDFRDRLSDQSNQARLDKLKRNARLKGLQLGRTAGQELSPGGIASDRPVEVRGSAIAREVDAWHRTERRGKRRKFRKTGKVKVLMRVTRNANYEYWLGGDRIEPEKIYECPIAEDQGFVRLEAIGPEQDDWIFSIKRRINNITTAITLYGDGSQYIYDQDSHLVSTVRYAGGGVWANFLIRSMDETLGLQQTIRNITRPPIGYSSLFDSHPDVVSGSVGIGSNSFYSWSIPNVVGGSPGGSVVTLDREYLIPYIPDPEYFTTLSFNQRGEQRGTAIVTTTTRASQNDAQAGLLSPYAACPPTPGASAVMTAGQQVRNTANDFNATFETNAFSVLLYKGQKSQSAGYYRHTQQIYQTFTKTSYLGSRDVKISQTCVTFGEPTGRTGMATSETFYPQDTPEVSTGFLDTEAFDTDIDVLLLPNQTKKYKDRRVRTGTTGFGSGPTVYERTAVVEGNIYGDATAVFWGEVLYDQNLAITSDTRYLRIGTTDYTINPNSIALFSTQNKLLSAFSPTNNGFAFYRCSDISLPPDDINAFASSTLDSIKNTILSEDAIVNVTKWSYTPTSEIVLDITSQETILNMSNVNSSVDNISILAAQYLD